MATLPYIDASTRAQYDATLLPQEEPWRARQPFLKSKGYLLRSRLQAGWKPSWSGNVMARWTSEDAILTPARASLIDARRISDNELVYIKRLRTDCTEMQIATFLASETHSRDPRNHCVPVLDTFGDPDDPEFSYMVMPFLREMESPPFAVVDEVVDFADQILEGLAFLHEQRVAHRDCTRRNLLMDGNALFPSGFHPINQMSLPDASGPAPYRNRSDVPVRYYYVDFGISVYFHAERENKLVLGMDGRDQEVPELSSKIPYDPYKVDIFIIGNVFRRTFHDKYTNVEFLLPLVEAMTQTDPTRRPDAHSALLQWHQIRSTISLLQRKWRLRPRQDSWLAHLFFDTISLVRLVGYSGKRIGRWGAETQG
ncbi:hypothetical protein OBBRIDRAFT_776568 [Obba rivulosa]|uniref:Protein kinase domain-containing protein n=1 Tax=Obba rivulosa TaxID=1052685 RepID=A0A8E2ATF3_9APHY|nr:hypothetical protein OBBRIDRAFT_776568 [Obba rivulosa]